MLQKIKTLAAKYLPEVTTIRRHLHAHPELSFHEYNTSAYIKSVLDKYNIAYTVMANTGVVVCLEGVNPSHKTIGLRADIDALPIVEANDVSYKSTNQGVMHACGHDAHTASLLGAIFILNELKTEWEGTIKCVFQPAEEKLPGGASLMIKEGVLENPKVQNMIGQHVMPLIEAGQVGFRSGKYMASTDELYLTIYGKGGHGAMPHLNTDPVLIASHIIVALQQVVSRVANPTIPSVLSFGKVIANGATNVIPDKVYIEGTFRTLDEVWRAEAHTKMTKIIELMAESMGGRAEFEIRKGYPFLVNDAATTAVARTAAEAYLGKENVLDLDIWMAAEDFAYYSQEVPSCFYRLGTRSTSRGITSSVHTATFDIEEASLEIGCGLMAYIALQNL